MHRITTFNNLFITQKFPRVSWIKLYWEFVDSNGYLKQDLYGKFGLHLKWKGKELMGRYIKRFQDSHS